MSSLPREFSGMDSAGSDFVGSVENKTCHQLSSAAQEQADCLGDLAELIGKTCGLTPMDASQVITHVFQGLIHQFFERGVVYFPNFGWLRYENGDIAFDKNAAFHQTLEKMRVAIDAESFSLAGIEVLIEKKLHGL